MFLDPDIIFYITVCGCTSTDRSCSKGSLSRLTPPRRRASTTASNVFCRIPTNSCPTSNPQPHLQENTKHPLLVFPCSFSHLLHRSFRLPPLACPFARNSPATRCTIHTTLSRSIATFCSSSSSCLPLSVWLPNSTVWWVRT
jgi:hypothetical protein